MIESTVEGLKQVNLSSQFPLSKQVDAVDKANNQQLHRSKRVCVSSSMYSSFVICD